MLKIYNTLSQKKETLKPLDGSQGKKLKLFVCGPTVYDFSHIGHARTYIAFDMIVKYLRISGYDVFYLQNITDIDDKIIQRAKERKILPKELAELFEKEYIQDMKALKNDGVSKYARATSHIKEIISQVDRLLKKGYAYQMEDGIYYNISKFKEYGKLSRRTALQAEDAVSRIDESKDKRNKGDFCLWKFSPKESIQLPTGQAKPFAEPSWPSPWGAGRPGWHIEDTAITEKFFGPQYDIHGGARDLIFPHHEAEISQMEAISGKKPLVKYWFHSGFLTVKGQRMGKSLGNFITIKDFLKEHSARILRFLIIKNHYRSPFDYNESLIQQTMKELERIDNFIDRIRRVKTKGKSRINISKFEMAFNNTMEDDFNTPKAIAVIFELINKGNVLLSKNTLDSSDAKDILDFLKKADQSFNFIFWTKTKEKTPADIIELVNQREQYRQEKNWQKSDELRKLIEEAGFQIEDTKEGPKIKRV